jgi:hypothetical protein
MDLSSTVLVHELRSELVEIKTSLSELLRLFLEAQNNSSAMESRIGELETASAARKKRSSSADSLWVCPVCRESFAHRESFKGHVSRLAQPKSERSHCKLDPDNTEHQKLLSDPRFGDPNGDWNERALSFGQQFYHTVKCHSVSTRSSEQSHSAVSDLWVI